MQAAETRPVSEPADRRAFWTRSNDDAHEFMFGKILPYPVVECGESLVGLPQAVATAGVVVYFAEKPHVRGLPRQFYLREGQIYQFIAAARAFNARGWAIRVEDAFRSRDMQKYLGREPAVFDAILRQVIWELDGQRPTPEFMFKRCSGLVATVPKFGTHMSGSAIDLSVVERDNPGQEIDRGAPYLEMSALTPMETPFISSEARANRQAITALMDEFGFVAYPWEFWHYSSGDAYDQFLRATGQPARYGAVDFDPATGRVTSLADPLQALNTSEEIRAEVDRALARS